GRSVSNRASDSIRSITPPTNARPPKARPLSVRLQAAESSPKRFANNTAEPARSRRKRSNDSRRIAPSVSGTEIIARQTVPKHRARAVLAAERIALAHAGRSTRNADPIHLRVPPDRATLAAVRAIGRTLALDLSFAELALPGRRAVIAIRISAGVTADVS